MDAPAVVLDVGLAYTKCGFAGEAAPREVLRTFWRTSDGRRLDPHAVSSSSGEESEAGEGAHRGSAAEWTEAAEELLRHIFFVALQASPLEQQVVFCDHLALPSTLREALARALFDRLRVPSVVFVPGTGLPLYAYRLSSGLVLDVGHSFARCLPVCDGVPIFAALSSASAGGRTLRRCLRQLASETSGVDGLLSEDVLEAACSGLCATPPGHEPQAASVRLYNSAPDSSVPSAERLRAREAASRQNVQPSEEPQLALQPTEVTIPGQARTRAVEALFDDPEDGGSCAGCVLDSLALCSDLHLRSRVAQHVVIAGGCATIPGFHQRVFDEIENLLQRASDASSASHLRWGALVPLRGRIRILPPLPLFSALILPWVGASIAGAMPHASSRFPFLTRDSYLSLNHILPDWSRADVDET